MKHTNIASTLGWAEVPDNTEGLFLQPEELSAVDTALGSVSAITTERDTAVSELATANARISTLESEAVTAQTTITGLENKVAELGEKPSGTGTALAASAEESAEVLLEQNEKPRFDAKDHPANRFADSYKKYDRGF